MRVNSVWQGARAGRALSRGALLLGLSLLAAAAGAQQPAPAEKEVAQGVAYLRGQQQADGSWQHAAPAGLTALAGYTLLECGATADDPAVRRAAEAVRRRLPPLTHTYSLALAAVFLDKLGKPEDEAFIQAVGLRLLSGQRLSGGWSYHCPPLSAAEVKRMKKWVEEGPPRSERGQLLPELRKQAQALQRGTALADVPGDASNTHFAWWGLWAAARHGVPARQAARARSKQRFLFSQQPKGGWGYLAGGVAAMHTQTGPLHPVTMVDLLTKPYPLAGANVTYKFTAGWHLAPGMMPSRWPDGFLKPEGVAVGDRHDVLLLAKHGWPLSLPGFVRPISTGGVQIYAGIIKQMIPRSVVFGRPGIIGPSTPFVPSYGTGWIVLERDTAPVLQAPDQQGKADHKQALITGNDLPVPTGPPQVWVPTADPDGKPGPRPRPAGPTPGLTSEVLLDIGILRGFQRKYPPSGPAPAPDPRLPRVIEAGLIALPHLLDRAPEAGPNPFGPAPGDLSFYQLWSLQQMADAYGLTTLGGKDWFSWGQSILLKKQQPDGSWPGAYGPGPDTCFALLFLKRATLPDLPKLLEGEVKDPGKRPLPKPLPPEEQQAEWLAQTLVTSPPHLQDWLVQQMRDSREADAQAVLTRAIAALDKAGGQALGSAEKPRPSPKGKVVPPAGKVRDKLRGALATRLSKLKGAALREQLEGGEAEVRRAAAAACALQKDKRHVPALIAALKDEDSGVSAAAHAALKKLTRHDFGPRPGASAEQVEHAVAAWQDWFLKQPQPAGKRCGG